MLSVRNNPTEGTTSFVDEIYGEITVIIYDRDMILIKIGWISNIQLRKRS